MKKIILAVLLLLLAFTFAVAQKETTAVKEKPVERVQVTAQAIAGQPEGKAYVIDLTRGRKVYSVPTNVDSSRIRIRTRTGDVVLGDMMKQMRMSGGVTVGTLSDMRALNFTRTGGSGGLSYDCTGSETCSCTGFDDCLKLILDDKCKVDGILVCSKGYCACTKR